MPDNQILTLDQMRCAEAALIAAGTPVEALMDRAGRGAAHWVWRMAAGRAVTVLVGPGNNGGDGWVLAEELRQRGGAVTVVEAHAPRGGAAQAAKAAYRGAVLARECATDGATDGAVLVDALFGSGLTRALTAEDAALLVRLALRARALQWLVLTAARAARAATAQWAASAAWVVPRPPV